MKNYVIEVLDENHAEEVRQYFTNKGIDVSAFCFCNTKEGNDKNRYYGIINNRFYCYSLSQVERENAEIIKLPLTFPRIMYVSSNRSGNKFKRVVIANKKDKYIAWKSAESIEEAKEEIYTVAWNNAEEIEEIEEIETVEITLEEIAKLKGVSVDKIKIVK